MSATSLPALLADYASAHRTPGNRVCHALGIPLIVLSLLGLLARLPLGGPVDAALLLLVLAGTWYLRVARGLGLATLAAGTLLYLLGRSLPLPLLVALQALGWLAQALGHAVWERSRPAFARHAVHLLVGPLWLVAKALERRVVAR